MTRYNEGGISVVEAGTGTGKSLAYLLPAAIWALRNGERTVVSTNTINLQEQLVHKDLPLVRKILGEDLSWTLVKGRGNYVSIRRLLLAATTAGDLFEGDRSAELEALVAWSRSTRDGSLSDLAAPPSDEVWEEVRSDKDICMGARCPHFQACFFQEARRKAASADLLVANHALLFADVSLRRATDNWAQPAVLPAYRHLILDEGHNAEDAATSHLGAEVTRIGMFRAVDRLDRGGKGLLRAVEEALAGSSDHGGEAPALLERIARRIRPAAGRARDALAGFFDAVEPFVPAEGDEPLRLGRGDPRDPSEGVEVLERWDALGAALDRLRREVEELRLRIEEDETLVDRLAGRVLDLRSVERRLEAARNGVGLVLDPREDRGRFVRWIEGRGGPRSPLRNVLLAAAPVEPGAVLRESLFRKMSTTVVTSATLTVGAGDFRFLRERLGLEPGEAETGSGSAGGRAQAFAFADAGVPVLEEPPEAPLEVSETALASPFDYASQAVFGVPTDLPAPHAWNAFQEATARVVLDFARITGGGIFVLFTSHRALRSVGRLLREGGGGAGWPVLVHGEAPRFRLLDDFVRSRRAILLGTSSFWEGVDVPGHPLRGLVLQKIPFRVPNEPITQARMEAIEERGRSAFNTYLVPLAALRLRQGFGRLLRTRVDRGAILLLDSRILTRSYGRTLRRSLPDAPLLKGPWEELRGGLTDFYGEQGHPGREAGTG